MLSSLELLAALLPEEHPAKARRLLKRHLETFAELRDTHVHLLLVQKLLPQFPEMNVVEAALLKREHRCVKRARKGIEHLKTAALDDLIDGLRRELQALEDRSARTTSLKAVERAFAEVDRRHRRITAADTRTIHRTRVAFKHFRYMVEGLGDALPGVTSSRLRAMRSYQTAMGEIQDREVFLLALQRFARKKKVNPTAAAQWFAEVERQKRLLIGRYLKRADALHSFWPLPTFTIPGSPTTD